MDARDGGREIGHWLAGRRRRVRGPVMGPGAGGTGAGLPVTRGGGGGQAVTGSVVLGDVIQIQHVGGNVSVTLSRPTYRMEEFSAVAAGLTVAQARAQPSRLLLRGCPQTVE